MTDQSLRGIDISEDVAMWKDHAVDPNDCWQDYIGWKTLSEEGYQAVIINGEAFLYNKWGPTESISISQVVV